MYDEENHGFRLYRRGCRCDACKKGNADYQRNYQANRKAKAQTKEVTRDPATASS